MVVTSASAMTVTGTHGEVEISAGDQVVTITRMTIVLVVGTLYTRTHVLAHRLLALSASPIPTRARTTTSATSATDGATGRPSVLQDVIAYAISCHN